MRLLLLLLTFSSFVIAQNSFNVNIEGLVAGDSIRIITQKGVELQFEQWVVGLENSQVSAEFELESGEWAVFLDAPGYYFPSSQLVNIPNDTSAIFTLSEASGEDFSYSWQEDDSYVGHATQVYVNEPLEIVVLNDTVQVPSDYSAIKLRNQYGVVLSNEEEIWSIDDSYRLYKMFESLPINPFGEGTNVDFETGENITGVFTLSNNNLDQDLELTTIDGVKHARVGKDAFTYASPQIVTINEIKGKFYSKRLYHVIVNFITNFANDDDMVNWIAQESFGVTFMQPNQELEDLMNEDSSNFQEFFSEEKLEILAMFEELPEGFHKQDGLKYLVRRVNGQVNPQYPSAAAIAWTGLETIEWMSVAFTGEINDTRRLILHEKAHFLWAYSFDQNIKDEWIEIGGWFEDPTAGSGWSTNQTTGFVSPYSHAINPNEDMAESIAYYLTNPDALLAVSVQKFEFIRDRIMHGTRYVAMIPDELTFTVYNLFPDYTFPGKVTKMEVSVSGAPDEDKEVTIKATMNSINPNVDGATAGYMRLVSSVGTIHDTWMQTENGQELDSVLVGTTTFSKLEKSGYWNMSYFRVFDQVGNQRYENTSTIGWKLFIENPLEDVTPPSWNYDLEMEIVEDYFTPNYNTEPSDEENGVLMKAIKFAYTVYDNSPMQRAITRIFHPTLDNPDAEVYEKQIDGGPINIDSPEYYNDYDSNKTFEQYLAIPEWFPSGHYAVSMINMYDLGGNSSNTYFVNDTTDFHISPLQINKIFKDVRDSIYVQTQFPDHIQPQLDLDNITIVAEPTNPEAPNGETRVDITMIARDLSDYEGHESGVASVGFVLRDPLGEEHGFTTGNSTMNHPELDLYDFNPDSNSNWALYHFDFVLPVGSPPGEWGMSSAQIRDKAGNIKNYSFIEYVRFEIIESDIELEIPLEAEILSDFVNAYNVENLSASISCSPCEGLNYVYTIYSLTGGNVVQGTGVFSSDSIVLEEINTTGVLDGHINLTVQVTDTENQLIATKTTQYLKDTFFPTSYLISSNLQDQGASNLDDFILSVIVEEQDIGGTFEINISSIQDGAPQSFSLLSSNNSYIGNIESNNFDFLGIDFSSFDDGYIEIELVITDAVGNEGQPVSSYFLLENGTISVAESLQVDSNYFTLFKIYPNPTQDFWHIESNQIINTIEVFDLMGRKVDFLTPIDTEISISAQNLPSGLYFLVVNRDTTLRLIKN
jgi:hypothetical protein